MAKTLTGELTKGFWDVLPPFRLVLGLCPTLAVTTAVENGIGMGLATTFVLVFSNIIISSIKSLIPKKVRIASYIMVIATFVVMVELLMKAYFFSISERLGIFIPLIVVNCIILGRAEAFASKNPVYLSFSDGLGIGLGFTMSLFTISAIREILGKGMFLGMNVMWDGFEPFSFMVEAPGAFVCLGILLGIINIIPKK
ncbi:MAG: RnfABCDGE type electron transport complex subunit E [Candidatus Aminicenantes bacterium]|nr:RnfABCDGE type electron transport complex subunit E [Candidatus Aminicenantes bacterium]NIM81483.1 RnfABCDGE type electron transport complex subunit E [Candidatus Aminicenantes bacterium]NIN20849.1 RnfABCDGE type electron transport complex subunit E [Candidatus Aminicenantes bacterium]NIN44670.1 RnfABCDGE type electron transport complex subunit E [Candidatus Aminicenantes bacterium]NIN87479.1 RnfABCDGE type electron transport complex subunit E [Candidatus Aminicenantes bacterium]